ncbi:MAG: hypothetical protein MJY84_06215 [Bacteroidales bacterium]|nr:hypothetical protein [Bacteroidales bacterium]
MKCEFNWKRFGKYFLYDLKCMKRKVLPYFIIPVLAPVALELIWRLGETVRFSSVYAHGTVGGPELFIRQMIFLVAIVLMVMFAPGRLYGELTDKVKGSEWLMLPASRGEKFLSMELISVLILPVVFLAGYYFTDWLICIFDKSVGTSLFNADKAGFVEKEFEYAINIRIWKIAYYSVAFLTGALLFKKPRWKIAGTIVLICLVAAMTAGNLRLLSRIEWFNNFLNYLLESGIYAIFKIIFPVLIIGGLAVINWFKIKNLEH